jgi:hypothetical protein
MSFEALASLQGAKMQASASKKAAAIYAQVSREQIQAQKDMFNKTEANLTPWREAGTKALNTLSGMVEAGPGEFTESPGYQFRLDEGSKMIERAAASKGSVLSGATLKGLERFTQDYASNEYNNFLAQYYDSLKPFENLSNTGQNAAAQIGSFGADSVNSQTGIAMDNALYQGSAIQNQGAYKAQGVAGAANSYSVKGAVNNVLSLYSAWKGGAGSRAN